MFCWTLADHCREGVSPGHVAVAVQHKVYVFGLVLFKPLINVDVFNTVSLRWSDLPPLTTGEDETPTRACEHTAALIEETAYIWGLCPDAHVLYAFDVATHVWSKPGVSGCVPQARSDHASCVLRKVMYVHGGRLSDFTAARTNDVYKLDTATMVCSVINTGGTAPPASEGHSATVIGTKMFVFGGCGNEWEEYYNDVRVFDTETNLWLSTPSARPPLPEERSYHAAFMFNGELYVAGGENSDFHVRDNMWKFNPETFSWKKVRPEGKGPSMVTRMSCCMVGDQVVLVDDLLYVLDLSPSLKTLCKLAVTQCDLERSELPHDIRWELEAMSSSDGRGAFESFPGHMLIDLFIG